MRYIRCCFHHLFLSTPSARRVTAAYSDYPSMFFISIHTLREEGDGGVGTEGVSHSISIHTLREEGDFASADFQFWYFVISIHTLREEGDAYIMR